MDVRQRACGKGQVFDAHFGDFIHNHVHNVISVAEVVVERNRHAVPKAGQADCFCKGRNNLVLRAHALVEGFLRLRGRAGKAAVLRGNFIDVRDFLDIDALHGVKPPLQA